MHDALEVHYRHRQLGIALDANDVVQRLADSWDEAVAAADLRFEADDESPKLKQQAAGLVQAYLAHVDNQEPKPLAVETSLEAPLIDPFTGEDLGLPLTGIVDLILDDPGGPRICDFKAASKSTAPFEITYEIQLTATRTCIVRQPARTKVVSKSGRSSKPKRRRSRSTTVRPGPTRTFGVCSPSSARTSMISTPAGSLTGPASAAPFAIIATVLVRLGKLNRPPPGRPGIQALAHRKEHRMDFILEVVVVAAAGYVGYQVGRIVGYEQGLRQRNGRNSHAN